MMSETRSCEHCGAVLAADARFCETCGRSVSAPSAPAVSGVAAPSATPRTNKPAWLAAGCIIAVVVIACIAVIAVGGFFYLQSTTKAPATPTLIAVLSPSTPTRALNTVVVPPPTLPAPAITPTTAPSPTPTTAPSPTPSPTPKCPPTPALPAGVLFSDDFGSRQVSECNGWNITAGENVDYTWSANKLTISVKKKLRLGWSAPDGEYDNFGVETEAQPISDDYAEYGLVFRVSGAENTRNYYLLGITSDGKYFVFKQIAGKWSEVDPVKRTLAPSVKPGKNKNLIGVIAQGNNFALYINRVLVNTITDDSLVGKGVVGVIAGTGENNANAVVAFSRLTILTPDKARAEWSSAPVPTQPPSQPTSAVPPGLYVSALRMEPGPQRGVDIAFYPMFLNTTGGIQSYRVKVYLYRAENLRNSFGETSAAPIAIPVGMTEQKALGSWKLSGGGGCEDFIARVGWIDEQNRITFFNAPGSGTFESRFPVCP